MNWCPNYASHLHQCNTQSCGVNGMAIKSFKRLGYEQHLSCLSCGANWFVCTKCMERQSHSHTMKMHVESWGDILTHLRKIPHRNVNITSLETCQHNELMSTFSSDAQIFCIMIENENDGNAEKKQKRQCYLGQ